MQKQELLGNAQSTQQNQQYGLYGRGTDQRRESKKFNAINDCYGKALVMDVGNTRQKKAKFLEGKIGLQR